MQKPITFILFLCSIPLINAQTIVVPPYLQDATPNSIRILWETDTLEESIVEWGLSEALGESTTGTSFINNAPSMIHEVQLIGLTRFTTYYYRVKTQGAISDVHQFKTPPFASDHRSFRLVAMSDMQKDNNNPDKFLEIVEDGIIPQIENNYDGNLSDNLAMVLIPGDLVDNGDEFSQWADHFFIPGQSLFNEVPVYPAIGNHERNSMYYFNYFHLPNNGTEGFKEHWWYKDYSNLRVIGLNSNPPYDAINQLEWLDSVLVNTCANDSIDFVFAQLHHPYHSELWTPGESDFTGEVIQRLEQFSTDCGKPSIHFFGHTHAYSRGQSRDHKHLMINVATAGGAIDNWGEFPNFDYPEYSKSFDDWGFVTVDVTAGENPKFTIKRYSRGNDAIPLDNVLRDSFTIRLQPEEVQTPLAIYPIDEMVNPECTTLKAGSFSSNSPNKFHGQSHWQVAYNCEDFSNPIVEKWKNFENIYADIDTQAEDDLTDEQIFGLQENISYCWRVRYRDQELNWSEWSTPVTFTTGASSFSQNLLVNPGAEDGLWLWTTTKGISEALTDGECNGTTPHSGEKYFAVGGLCEESAYAECIQIVNISTYGDSIDTGEWYANFGGYLSDYNGSDLPEIKLFFQGQGGEILDSTLNYSSLSPNWTFINEVTNIPVGTRFIQFTLRGTRNGGVDNDSYFDDLFLKLGQVDNDCTPIVDGVYSRDVTIEKYNVTPNPFSDFGNITIQSNKHSQINIRIRNALGQTVNCPIEINPERITINKGNLSNGIYYFEILEQNTPIGQGQFVISNCSK